MTSPSAERSRIMRAVKSSGTQPELLVRRMAHGLGYRFRLGRTDLPGKPDLTFPRLCKVVFVHGCFWHGHGCARGARVPRQNREYWIAKIERNRSRDRLTPRRLRSMGWRALTIWECETRHVARLGARLGKFLAGK